MRLRTSWIDPSDFIEARPEKQSRKRFVERGAAACIRLISKVR